MSGLPDGTRLVISGNPTPEEIAAVVAALDVALQRDDNRVRSRSGWREAARREGVGGRLMRSRADLDNPLP